MGRRGLGYGANKHLYCILKIGNWRALIDRCPWDDDDVG